MENKVLVKLLVPEIDEVFDLFLPINKKIGNVINLLVKAIGELSNNAFQGDNFTELINANTGEIYKINELLKNTNIRNNTKLVLLTNKNSWFIQLFFYLYFLDIRLDAFIFSIVEDFLMISVDRLLKLFITLFILEI